MPPGVVYFDDLTPIAIYWLVTIARLMPELAKEAASIFGPSRRPTRLIDRRGEHERRWHDRGYMMTNGMVYSMAASALPKW